MQYTDQLEFIRTEKNTIEKTRTENRIDMDMTYSNSLSSMCRQSPSRMNNYAMLLINKVETDRGQGKFLMIHLDAMGIYGDDITTVYSKYAKEDVSTFIRAIFDRRLTVYEVL